MRTIAIVEPHRWTRAGIEHAISESAGLRVTASVSNVDDLGDHLAEVVILNPHACPAGVGPAITRLAASAAVLLMPISPGSSDLQQALQAGASGFLTPDADDAELLTAIEAVACGALYVMAGLAPRLHGGLEGSTTGGTTGLARREIETLRLIAHGYTHGQVARRMGLTEATINTYVKRIRAKLNVGNKAELTRKAIDLGYLSPSGQVGAYALADSPRLSNVRLVSLSG